MSVWTDSEEICNPVKINLVSEKRGDWKCSQYMYYL